MTVRLRLEVLCPDESVFDDEVDAIVAPLADGWRGILPGRLPFTARLMEGEVLFRAKGADRMLATIGGTIAVTDQVVTILTGGAVLDRNLDTLEHELHERIERIAAAQTEAEKHFDRVYRELARATDRRVSGV